MLLLVASGQALADSDTASGLDFTPDFPVAGEATIIGRTAGNTATDIAIPATVSDGGFLITWPVLGLLLLPFAASPR
ncbi:MAG: hypothetical protein HOI09_07430 [Porticoccaceae bacterium]|nr:hypothetical protein [Porticoccaceae bacterium]